MFFASVKITSDEIGILGFSIRLQQDDLVAIGRLGTSLALVVFLLFVLPALFKRFIDSTVAASEAKRDRDLEIAAILEGLTEEEREHEIGNDFDDAEVAHRQRVAKWQYREKLLVFSLTNLRKFLLEVGLPVAIALIAVFSPKLLSETATYFFIAN
jgi:hypothetical protein